MVKESVGIEWGFGWGGNPEKLNCADIWRIPEAQCWRRNTLLPSCRFPCCRNLAVKRSAKLSNHEQ